MSRDARLAFSRLSRAAAAAASPKARPFSRATLAVSRPGALCSTLGARGTSSPRRSPFGSSILAVTAASVSALAGIKIIVSSSAASPVPRSKVSCAVAEPQTASAAIAKSFLMGAYTIEGVLRSNLTKRAALIVVRGTLFPPRPCLRLAGVGYARFRALSKWDQQGDRHDRDVVTRLARWPRSACWQGAPAVVVPAVVPAMAARGRSVSPSWTRRSTTRRTSS